VGFLLYLDVEDQRVSFHQVEQVLDDFLWGNLPERMTSRT
jgi:hypothetical protein